MSDLAGLIERLDPSGREAVRSLVAERLRQRSVECWTPEHDDEHTRGEMAIAAACYAKNAAGIDDLTVHPGEDGEPSKLLPRHWPWGSWWKPKNPRRDLERAGALILAELERLERSRQAQRRRE